MKGILQKIENLYKMEVPPVRSFNKVLYSSVSEGTLKLTEVLLHQNYKSLFHLRPDLLPLQQHFIFATPKQLWLAHHQPKLTSDLVWVS